MNYQHHYTDGTPIHYPLGKVVCIGRNYAEHAKELNNPVPTDAVIRTVTWPARCICSRIPKTSAYATASKHDPDY